ncbi:MAG: tyrosine--tRNA ligase [Candidatus Zambryskibacteria bacterium RIFOXYD1_FULL_40_13]|nr:MAG: Tyrosyl-tRNA synthetase [Parcubacteria group bacterium GW2011_GWC1_39_12]KKR19470.1 MAG: Tyrosyl-tRNA synthetase [Parcubacteria group bacterium GW2011_GWF1_39_37]KKR35096.1 MAG: Tyrosyl-tRNA synthetase [Parcubacteria group bacterium GW2011_GWC2_40_10]KKR52419.1 MAG: Tyrosyl-tRNA synthetase [Parcubacteria group bacterium GW2011_GWE1_40_20]KKR69483.1 MAG: Tyrosyl-tRNA synthetase [Parcubacteria group bacterium GW2011_GWF2_40_69]KKR81900.1 MAG: Tyrosyl-tRNA synthetase [Parcubacteria group 
MFNLSKQKTSVDEKEIDELLTRGVENVFPTREFLKAKMMRGERVTLYLGIDPTGPTLHMGHVIPILKLKKFQQMGHQIILLMGDFTAMIGDPSDKTATRKKLSHDEVMKNLEGYKKQASKFISFSGPNGALFKFNSKWLGKLNFEDVLNLASEMTVQQMLERDMFQNRVKEGKPIYIHEFMYPLMQGYDSVAMDVDGEIGGNDQTFNMLAGRNLMKSLKNKEKFVIAMKLLVDPTGKKMGKTENNMVAMNQSPEEIFGKVMSWADEMVVPGLELITDVPMPDIASAKESMDSGNNPKEHKVFLAREVVKMCYGEKEADRAEAEFENTFSKGGVPENVLEVTVAKNTSLVDILMVEQVVVSKSDFRRLVAEGAVTSMSSGGKIVDPDVLVSEDTYKIGKRRFIKIKVL